MEWGCIEMGFSVGHTAVWSPIGWKNELAAALFSQLVDRFP